MASYVMCISSASGLPILSRNRGTENLPFSVIGSLNGVHMFAKSQNIELLNTETDDYKVVWKEFLNSIVLIGISSGCTVTVLNKFLQSVYNTLVLIVGTEEIKAQKNLERLKRELRVCYPIVERLMDSLNCGDTNNKASSDLITLTETILCPENNLIQIVLDTYSECIDSMFSCVLIHGKIAAATESWWSLHPEELKLLSLLAVAENVTSSKDIPVYLPYRSPTAAFRFVACSLVPNVQVCSLCGSTPSLPEIENSAAQCFKNTLEILNAAVHCHPRNFPYSIQLDPAILGVLLINTKFGKYMISKNPQPTTATKRTGSSSHRLDILRTFYYEAILTRLIPSSEDETPTSVDKKDESNTKTDVCVGTETYWCSEYHKCHGAKVDDNVLCILYNSSVPTHAMRLITQKTLKLLISDKQVCW